MNEMWEELIQLLVLDMLHERLLKEGYAINGGGIAINMDEIKKAEEMYNDV